MGSGWGIGWYSGYMDWIISTFETKRGEKPVDEFINKQQPQAQAKIVHNVRLLRQYGSRLGMPHAKMLGSGLYELRMRGKEELRILYCFTSTAIHLLHAFKKQTQKTPQREMDVAVERMKSLHVIDKT